MFGAPDSDIQVEQNEKSIAASLEISDDKEDMEEEEDDNGRLRLPPHRHTHNAQASPWTHKVLLGRLVRSGVIYWSRCVEGLIVMGVVYIGC